MNKPAGMSHEADVSWHRLRAWIDEQEAKQAPLSPAQRVAIATLLAPAAEPEVGERDYVSDLCRAYPPFRAPVKGNDEADSFHSPMTEHAQAKRRPLPEFSWKKVVVTVSGVPQLRWQGFCTLQGDAEKLPKAGYGFAAGDECPSFQVKKKAKQYAAKQALAFLKDQTRGNVPATAVSPSSSPVSPLAKRLKIGREGSRATPSPSPSRSSSSDDDDDDDDDDEDDSGPTLPERVASLATKLNFGSLRYRIEPEDGQPGFFKGRPHFPRDARVPEDLAVVRGILGRQKTRLAIAERVLGWLEAEDRARQETTERLLATLDSVPR